MDLVRQRYPQAHQLWWCVHTVPQRVTRTVMRAIHKMTVEVIMETWLLNTELSDLLCSVLAASVRWDPVSQMSDPSRMVRSQLVKLACKIPVTVLSPWVLQQPKSKTVPVACFLCFGSWNKNMSQRVPITQGRIPPMLISTTSPLKRSLTCSICPSMSTVVGGIKHRCRSVKAQAGHLVLYSITTPVSDGTWSDLPFPF